MEYKFNSFCKNPDNKTGYLLTEGQPIFTKAVYLIQPYYVHGRSPAFSLVSKGKHLSGFFPLAPSTYIGDFQKKALILFKRELGFDLFLTDIDPVTARELLISGQLNDQLFQARQSA